jgi:hypothetical protein
MAERLATNAPCHSSATAIKPTNILAIQRPATASDSAKEFSIIKYSLK